MNSDWPIRNAQRRSFFNRITISSIKTTFLRGGMTSAKVAVVLMTAKLLPVVVKMDLKDLVKEEARRFLRFIALRDSVLRPEVHFHSNSALLLFGLVGDVGDDSAPAPQLDLRLRDLWYAQLYGSVGNLSPPALADLDMGISNAVSELGRLNRDTFGGEPIAGYSAPNSRALRELEGLGVQWGFDEASVRARRRAEDLFKAHANSAIVHGDIQLRNILLRADREAFLIDYAGSSPGHPAIDSVRLELSWFLAAFRQTTPETEVIQLQTEISLGQLTSIELASKYAHIVRLNVNNVALKGCLAAREEAMQVLAAYGAGLDDYLGGKSISPLRLQIYATSCAVTQGFGIVCRAARRDRLCCESLQVVRNLAFSIPQGFVCGDNIQQLRCDGGLAKLPRFGRERAETVFNIPLGHLH